MTLKYTGGCQCAKVRYEVQMEIQEVIACNCSRCGRLGSLLAFAPASQFRLISGHADLKDTNPSNSDLSREAHRLKAAIIVLRSEAIR